MEMEMEMEMAMRKKQKIAVEDRLAIDGKKSDDDEDALLSAVGDELGMEILVRLPAKSLFRSKCVSSRWLRLISDPMFVRCYSTINATVSVHPPPIPITTGFFQQFRYSEADHNFYEHTDDKIRFCPFELGLGKEEEEVVINYNNNFDLEFLGLKRTVLLSCSMGLLLCSDSRDVPTLYLVCNPITKQWLALPVPPRHHEFFSAHLHCYNDDSDSEESSKIEIPPNKFIVVLFVTEPEPNGSTALQVETFSSESGEWRLSSVEHPRSRFNSFLPCRGIFNSNAYWIDFEDGTIVAYDLKKGTLRFMPPAPGIDNPVFGCLSLSKGKGKGNNDILHYAESNETSLRIWERTFGGEWSLKHTISLQSLIDDSGNLGVTNFHRRFYSKQRAHKYLFMPLAFHPHDPDVVLLHLTGVVVSCHIVKRKLQVIFNYSGRENARRFRYSEVFPYTPTLWPAPVPSILYPTTTTSSPSSVS